MKPISIQFSSVLFRIMFSLRKIISNTIIILLLLRAQLNFAKITCKDFNSILLNNTNNKRRLHKVPDLILNPDLIPGAVEYAKELSGKCTLYHAQGDFGENLFLSVDSDTNFLNSNTDFGAINAFYSEISCYCGYETSCPPCVYGHFTQLVWGSTVSQGCGTCINEETFCLTVVCRYIPGGNMKGAYAENVLPPYGTQPPLWEVFRKASNKDYAIAAAILAVFFGIIVFSFILHQEYLPYYF